MSMDALITELLQQVRGIARDVLQREGVRLRTATVTATDPLRITYDGEDTPSVVPPRRAAVVALGDRVVVAKSRGQATILGVLGGGVAKPYRVPFTSLTYWDATGSPSDGILVTPVDGGLFCQGRLRLRRNYHESFVYGPTFTENSGSVIPPELRAPGADYVVTNFPASGNALAIIYVNFSDGRVLIRTTGENVTIVDGQYFYVDLSWFVPR